MQRNIVRCKYIRSMCRLVQHCTLAMADQMSMGKLKEDLSTTAGSDFSVLAHINL